VGAREKAIKIVDASQPFAIEFDVSEAEQHFSYLEAILLGANSTNCTSSSK
jgi:hypothetical protein